MNPPAPNMTPKPTAQNRIEPSMKSSKFFIKIFAVFLVRMKPASTKANPGCIKKTNIAASNIHTVSSDSAKSVIVYVVSIVLFVFVCYIEWSEGLFLLFRVVESDISPLSGAYADRVLYGDDENTPVTDLPGLR